MTATAPAAPAKVYFTNLRTHARESQLDKLKRLIRRAGIATKFPFPLLKR